MSFCTTVNHHGNPFDPSPVSQTHCAITCQATGASLPARCPHYSIEAPPNVKASWSLQQQQQTVQALHTSGMDTSKRSSTDDDEQQAQRDRVNKEILDIVDIRNAALLDEQNNDGLCKFVSPESFLDKLIKLEGEENELLRDEIDEKEVELEAANADLDAKIEIAKQQHKVLRTTIKLKLRTLTLWAIYGRFLDVTAIEDETWRIVQLLVDIRDAKARQHRANLLDIRRLLAEIDAED